MRAFAALLRVGVWGTTAFVVYYTVVAVPPIATALRDRGWDPVMPRLFAATMLLAIAGAVGHALLDTSRPPLRRVLVVLLVLPLTIFGAIGYYVLAVARSRRPSTSAAGAG